MRLQKIGRIIRSLMNVFLTLLSFHSRRYRASFNPARDLGTRIVTFLARWKWQAFVQCVPYLLGPMIGGPIGAFLADKVLML
jgi:glycerol uptake facilitator-like aquaporin